MDGVLELLDIVDLILILIIILIIIRPIQILNLFQFLSQFLLTLEQILLMVHLGLPMAHQAHLGPPMVLEQLHMEHLEHLELV